MSQQQQQQQLSAPPTVENLLHFMAQQSEAIQTLQQQLVAQNTPKLEVAVPPKFDGSREAVVGFVNACHLYTEARLGGVDDKGKISWVLSYIERGKRGFSCDKQKVNGSSSSPQSRAKGSEGSNGRKR